MKRTLFVMTLFVAALLAGFFLRSMTPPAIPVSVEEKQTVAKETFMQQQRGMPLDMESVEGSTGVAGYNGTPPLLGSEPKEVPERPYDMANDNQLFQFSTNKVGADCCPSPFSSDQGCICLTDAQISQFASRGGNR